jgi:Major Facilitator Superfamily.
MALNFKKTIRSCYLGYITQAILVNLAPIFFVIFQEDFGLTLTQIGQLALVNFVTQIATDFVAIKFVDKIGYRKSALVAHLFAAAGLILMSVLPFVMGEYAYGGLIISVMVYAVGGGLIEVIISPIVDAVPGDAKEAAMSLLHSFYCWGQVVVVLLTTVVIKIIGGDLWYILPILWALIPIFNFFNFIRVPLPEMVSAHDSMHLKELFSSKVFVLALVMMVCSGASELAMSQWASFFAEVGLGVPKLLGDILGPCLFAVCMGIGRVVYGFKGDKIDLRKALIACSIFATICYMVTVFVSNPIISLFGCAFCGFGASLMWPGMLSLTAKRCPTGGTALFAILALAGDAGCSIGPWLCGVVSDAVISSAKGAEMAQNMGLKLEQVGLKAGLLATSVFPLVMMIGVFIMKEKKVQK